MLETPRGGGRAAGPNCGGARGLCASPSLIGMDNSPLFSRLKCGRNHELETHLVRTIFCRGVLAFARRRRPLDNQGRRTVHWPHDGAGGTLRRTAGRHRRAVNRRACAAGWRVAPRAPTPTGGWPANSEPRIRRLLAAYLHRRGPRSGVLSEHDRRQFFEAAAGGRAPEKAAEIGACAAPMPTPTATLIPAPTPTPTPAPPSATPTATATPTSTPVPTKFTMPAPTSTPVAFSLAVDDDTTWGEAFDAFTSAEQDCIRDHVEQEMLKLAMEREFFDADGLLFHESIVVLCLAPQTARAVWLSAITAELAEAGFDVSGDAEQACLRDLLEGIAIGTHLPDVVTHVLEESPRLFVCSPHVYVDFAVGVAAYFGLEIVPNDREQACLQDWMTSADAEPERAMSGLDLSELLVYGIYVCVPDVSVNGVAQTVVGSYGMPVIPTDEEQACVDDVLTSQANAGPTVSPGRDDMAGMLLDIIACMPATFTDLIVQDAVDLGGTDVTLNEQKRVCAWGVLTRLADIDADYDGFDDVVVDMRLDVLECADPPIVAPTPTAS